MTQASKTKTALMAAALAAGLIALAGAATAQTPLPAGDAGRGKPLYYNNTCYGCHGFQGQTGARNLVGTNSPILAKPETFLSFLRQRGDFLPMVPSSNMPTFPASALSDRQALDIYAYIKTFVLDAPDVKTIQAFDAIQASAAAPYKPGK
jgi:mono/diheme cytochrome c family protein